MTLVSLCEFQVAAACADAQPLRTELDDGPRSPSIGRHANEMVLAPACEFVNLALCLLIFSISVLEPGSRETTNAWGATIYAVSAWSAYIPKVTGAMRGMGPRHTSSATAEPSLSPSDSCRAIDHREARQ